MSDAGNDQLDALIDGEATDRRDVLKKIAIGAGGAAVVWAAPTMTRANAAAAASDPDNNQGGGDGFLSVPLDPDQFALSGAPASATLAGGTITLEQTGFPSSTLVIPLPGPASRVTFRVDGIDAAYDPPPSTGIPSETVSLSVPGGATYSPVSSLFQGDHPNALPAAPQAGANVEIVGSPGPFGQISITIFRLPGSPGDGKVTLSNFNYLPG